MEMAGIYESTGSFFIRKTGRAPEWSPPAFAGGQSILRIVQEANDLSTGSAELAAHLPDPQAAYHLSAQPANLLRPFRQFLQHKTILVTGEGCGPIARFLGETAAAVTALETGQLQAMITAARCRDLSTVQVVCDHFSQFETTGRYDVVVFAGIPRYTHVITGTGHPLQSMLGKASALLNPGGVVMMAADHASDQQYPAGATEDQLEAPGSDMEDTPASRTSAVTRETLSGMLRIAGLGYQEFIFPYPGYRLPAVMVREAALVQPGFSLPSLLAPAGYDPDHNGSSAYPDVQEGFPGKPDGPLTNSFLAVGAKTPVSVMGNNVLAYAYSAGRKKGFSTETVYSCIPGDTIQVTASLLYPDELPAMPLPITQHLVHEKYVPGRLHAVEFFHIISAQGWSVAQLAGWTAPYYRLLQSLSGSIGGEPFLEGRYADLTPFKLVSTENSGLQVLGLEWEVHENIPLRYVLARGLYQCLAAAAVICQPAAGTPLNAFGIIQAVTNHFTPADGITEDFTEREMQYFLPATLNENLTATDFSLPILSSADRAEAPLRNNKPAQAHASGAMEQKELLIGMLENRIHELEHRISSFSALEREYHNTKAENELLKVHLRWYRLTYETRSLAGVLKDRFRKAVRPVYVKPLNVLLATSFIKKKYALTYMLEFAREKGLSQSAQALAAVFRKEGVRSILNSRTIARTQLQKSHVQQVPPAVFRPPVYDKRELLADMRRFPFMPKISVIIPVYNTDPYLLAQTIKSVQNQLYDNWELCIVDDHSTNEKTRQALERFAGDGRISILFSEQNEGISMASNAAIGMSSGDFIALLDHDDELTPDALYWVAREIASYPQTDVLYSDECKISERGELSDFFLKPDWSPELLFNMMYTGHLTVYRKLFLEESTGLFRKQFDFSQDYDLMLRAAEKTDRIRHIPKVLYHWRLTRGSASQGDKPYARASNVAALKDAVQRRGLHADVLELRHANRIRVHLDKTVLVSVIIPTDSFTNLQATVESILKHTTYPAFEIVVVTNSGLVHKVQPLNWPKVLFAPYDLPYNFSDKCNHGTATATGDIVIFFNDDVRPLQPDWIEHTIELLFLPGIGGVSPKLLYENDTIQYAGMATGVRNLTGTMFHGYPGNASGYMGFTQMVRDVSILSGACLAMKKSLFTGIGGFDPVNTPSAHSDVDLSFKILERQLRCVYTPYATLRHIGHLSLKEHETRAEPKKDKADIFLLRRWMKYLAEDPYFTRPMVSLLYHDSPEPYALYGPVKETVTGTKGDVLLVSHDFSQSGAPIMLYNICRILVANDYFPVVACQEDGPLRVMYQQLGVPVIIDKLLLKQHHTVAAFAGNFDYIICNTVVTWPIVKQLQHKVKTVWWIQEAQVIEYFAADFDFVRTLQQARNVVGVSDYAMSYLGRYNSHSRKIYNACVDSWQAGKAVKPDPEVAHKFIFSIIGSVERRKGQDILFNALDLVHRELLQDVEVWLVGRILDPAFLEAMGERISGKPYIKIKGEVSTDEVLDYVRASDVIISASRDDPFPVVLVEAFSLARPCIVSEHTGLFELVEDGRNGFTFSNESPHELAAKITLVLENRSQLEQIGLNARKTYERYMTMDKLEKKLLHYLGSLPDVETAVKLPQAKTVESHG